MRFIFHVCVTGRPSGPGGGGSGGPGGGAS